MLVFSNIYGIHKVELVFSVYTQIGLVLKVFGWFYLCSQHLSYEPPILASVQLMCACTFLIRRNKKREIKDLQFQFSTILQWKML